jgi:hypothetical protein
MMEEAHDHHRVTPEGRQMGEFIAKATEPLIQQLKEEGEPGECCKTCAFRRGTVPNGCPQTQLDALKCVMEGIPFFCHQDPKLQTICFGWFAARQAPGIKGTKMPVPWELSPPDETSQSTGDSAAEQKDPGNG